MGVEALRAYVIKTFTINEADRVAVLLTEKGDKVSAIARNGARLKSGVAGKLEPFNFVQIDLFIKDGQKLHPVNQVTLEKSYFKRISGDMTRFMVFSHLSELVDKTVHGEEGNPKIFRLLSHCFEALEGDIPVPLAVAYFQYWILKLAGMWPDENQCEQCGRPLSQHGEPAYRAGHFRCGSCVENGDRLPEGTWQLMQRMLKEPLTGLTDTGSSGVALMDVGKSLLDRYLGGELKSYPLMRPMLK